MFLLFFVAMLATSTAAFQISIYADVHKDVEFFTRTFPWIIDNIGGHLVLDYFLVGSGRYSIPQMCALDALRRNPFLQAQFLKCEAEGKPGGYCLCEAGINPQTFQRCVASGGYLAGLASNKFSHLGINFTPIIELGPKNSTVYGVEDIALLEEICTVFGRPLPRGCVHYTNQTESFPDKNSLAQFDRACHKEFPISGDDDKPVSPEPVPTPETTQSTTTTLSTTTEVPGWWTTTTTQGTTTPTPGWPTTTTTQGTTTPTPGWPTTTTTQGTTTMRVPDYSTSPTTQGTTTWVPDCSTNPSTQGTTSPMPDWWTTTTPPWWTTAPTWWTTSPWVTQTTPELSTPDWWWTTPNPWWSTTSPPWTATSTWMTQPPPWWLKIAPPSLKPQPELPKPYMQNDENTKLNPNITDEPETQKVPLE